MENTQPTKTENENESKAATLDASTKSRQKDTMPLGASKISSETMTAATPNGSTKTWTNAALAELESKAGLVAGALADFQAAGGLVAVKNIEYTTPSGSVFTATKLYLVAEGAHLKVQKTADGLDFSLVAAEESE
jgi:hypothetical protein